MRDLTLEKGLPANLDAERFVLGSIMIDDIYTRVAGLLEANDFSLETHRRIFLRMGELYKRGETIDRVTVANDLMRLDQLESVGGVSYLVSLDDGMPVIPNIESWARLVKEKSTLRRAALLANDLYNRCIEARDEPGAVLADAERLIHNLSQEQPLKGVGLRNFAEIIEDFGGLNSYSQNHDPGIQTPWPSVNRIIGGFRPGQMIVVAGLTGSGKSAFGLQVAQFAASQGHGTAVFSLEMSGQELFERLACGNAGLDSKKLERNCLTAAERNSFQASASRLTELPLWIDDSTSCTLPAIHATLRKHMHKHSVKLLVIDYLQLVQPVGSVRENRTQQVTEISRGLKLIAREYRIPVLVLAQFNRGPAVEKREPQLHDLRDSGSIEQDSDKVIFLHPKEPAPGTPPEAPVDVKLIIAKQRNGKRRRWVDFTFDGKFCQFEEMRQEHVRKDSA